MIVRLLTPKPAPEDHPTSRNTNHVPYDFLRSDLP
jgi:hypothetical protein